MSIDLQDIKKRLSRFFQNNEKILSSILKKSDDIEYRITSNYLAINTGYLRLHELNGLKYKYRQQSIEAEIKNLEKSYNSCIALAMRNLSELALENKPESFSKQVQGIKNYLKTEEEGQYFIFPNEDTIVLTFTIPYKSKNIVFSTVYSKEKSESYLNCLNFDILPGKFDLGTEVVCENIKDDLAYLLSEQIAGDLIEESIVQEPYIVVFPKEDINIHSLLGILLNLHTDNFLSYAVKNNAIYLEPRASSEELQKISTLLNLDSKNLYKLLTFTGA